MFFYYFSNNLQHVESTRRETATSSVWDMVCHRHALFISQVCLTFKSSETVPYIKVMLFQHPHNWRRITDSLVAVSMKGGEQLR